MNIQQIEFNLKFLVDEIRKKNQEEIKTICLKTIHRYSMYFIGNRNHLQQFQENKITIFGLLDQLVTDISNILTNQYGPPGSVVAHLPGNGFQRLDLSTVQDLCSELCSIAYGL